MVCLLTLGACARVTVVVLPEMVTDRLDGNDHVNNFGMHSVRSLLSLV